MKLKLHRNYSDIEIVSPQMKRLCRTLDLSVLQKAAIFRQYVLSILISGD